MDPASSAPDAPCSLHPPLSDSVCVYIRCGSTLGDLSSAIRTQFRFLVNYRCNVEISVRKSAFTRLIHIESQNVKIVRSFRLKYLNKYRLLVMLKLVHKLHRLIAALVRWRSINKWEFCTKCSALHWGQFCIASLESMEENIQPLQLNGSAKFWKVIEPCNMRSTTWAATIGLLGLCRVN